MWYEGSGTTGRRFLQADERGSVIALSDSTGASIGINRYDEYGVPQASNTGRFQYTGQTWYAELGMYNYKARLYAPTLGRFMQTDPIGYGDGLNWYNYVGSDPVNFMDPSGLGAWVCPTGGRCTFDPNATGDEDPNSPPIEVTARHETIYLDPGFTPIGYAGNTIGDFGTFVGDGIILDVKPKPQSEKKKLSPCMVNFLNRATSGTDWGSVRLNQGDAWGGRRASTSLNLVTFRSWRYAGDTNLLFHELGHQPDWQSGALTNLSYASESASAWWNDEDTWAGNQFEQNAELFRILVGDAYQEAGQPCQGNITSP